MKNKTKKRWKKFLNKRAGVAYFQIFLMIFSVVAVAFLMGLMNVGVVSAWSIDNKGRLIMNNGEKSDFYANKNGVVYKDRNWNPFNQKIGKFENGKFVATNKKYTYLENVLKDWSYGVDRYGNQRLSRTGITSVEPAGGTTTRITQQEAERTQAEQARRELSGVTGGGRTQEPSSTELGTRGETGRGTATDINALNGKKVIINGIEGTLRTDLDANGNDIVYFKNKDGTRRPLTDTEINSLLKGSETPPPDSTPASGGGIGGFVGGIIGDALWAASVYGLVKLVGGLVTDDKAMVDAIAAGAGAGVFVWKVLGEGGALSGVSKSISGWLGVSQGTVAFAGGLIVGVAVFLLLYKKESEEIIYFQCYPWDAPIGGEYCEDCNKQGILPCSEYQCKSLGQSCELLNPGSEEELCSWVHRQDVKPPVITAWEEALLIDYKYVPDEAISPPDRGVKVIKKDSTTGCLKAFTPLTFGIIVDKPAKCKIDYTRKKNFDDMLFYFGANSLFAYNHTQILSLPGPSAINSELPILQNNGEYELFVKCMDANGNANTGDFVFKFCVEKGPDTTPPLIVTTSLLNGMPVAYNQSSIPIDVYVNEPSTCKWSHRDQSYDEMEETMDCSRSVFEMNAQMLYRCKTTLTGLKNREENEFYFRCKDQPLRPENDINVNQQSYKFSLMGSQPLYIQEVGPDETIKDSTDVVKVTLTAETYAGYNDGIANCYYSDTGEDDSYVLFFDTNAVEHSQELFLASGNYEYFIKCIDLGGNSDEKKVSFSVESDSSAPKVVRVYHEENYLKLITDEEAECVYGKDNCNFAFADGISLKTVDKTKHYTDWNTNFNSYIKCKDKYGNQPLPNSCSIIARPFDIYKGG